MPRVVREPAMMDVDEPVVPEPAAPETATPEPAEPLVEPEEEEKEEYEETITLRALDFVAFQDILEDMQFQIANIQRDAQQDRLETQDMLRAIFDRLPLASGSSTSLAP
jgi:hypothetical protein